MEKIKHFCLIISLLGIFILLLIINFQETKLINIMQIFSNQEYQENQQVKITGKVISKQIYENNFTILNLKDSTGKIKVVCNCPNAKINQTLTIKGRTQKYQNQMQISADKIKT